MPFVRGNKIVVVSEPYTYFPGAPPGHLTLKIGDILTVARRRGSGWLRARNHRTQDVITLRVGSHIAAFPGLIQSSSKAAVRGESSPTSSTESLGERRRFKPLVCDIPGAPEEEVKKVCGEMENTSFEAAKKTIADLKQEIEQLREQNKALLNWRNKHLESTSNDAWELVHGKEVDPGCDE